ncbi:reelin domain-containing protein 1 [Arctopsyche grandis]|uniref:reelin domain-containing protein 1 n=1 Tax=Arctopsyche grandis TaxID=121162 RepID=UPI00406D78AF
MKLLLSICFIVYVTTPSLGFPDGAPVDACVKPRPNQPYHGQAKPQPPETLPYQVVASDSHYGPGSKITVAIQGLAPFKGFFLQARDVATNNWVGEWLHTSNTTIHPECASITHADPKEKQQATFVWIAPANIPPGEVYFTGTVLKDYGTFWSNLVAGVAQQENDLYERH